MSAKTALILPLSEVAASDIAFVGGKNASLGEMIQHLKRAGVKVPNGFALTTYAYQEFLNQQNLQTRIFELLAKVNVHNVEELQDASEKITQWIQQTPIPGKLSQKIEEVYAQMGEAHLAVRSSATAEDLPNASFAGQQETYLNVTSLKMLYSSIKKVFASMFTARAIAYRSHHKIDHQKVLMSVAIQHMVRSDKATSGVIFTLDTESGFDQVVLINASYGLGETVVKGQVNPDEFYVSKPLLRKGKSAILRKNIGEKALKMIFDEGHNQTVKNVEVPEKDRLQFCLSDAEIEGLAKYALLIEEHYGFPVDIEWAKDGETGELFIVQARPETVKSQDHEMERYHLLEKGPIKTQGRSVGERIGQGIARQVADPKQMDALHPGEVLVTEMTDPDWEPIMKLASAIVTNRGGRTCHAAIIARELGIPAIVGCRDATNTIKSGEEITVCCAEGETGIVYAGLLKFEVEKTSVSDLEELPVNLCLNLGNPDKAFSYQSLPNFGVGLARLEFIISNMIGIHPNALLKMETLPVKLREKISAKIAAYASPEEFYIEKLREGISTIAAAFYPKDVIFRFSDFKSNEYAGLLGGDLFEPKEENPMLGFRGASRYVSESFRDCFNFECEAFLRVRKNMGLTNTQVMVPFVRTVSELKNVIEIIEQFGLKRGDEGLKIYMMCEIPSNAILAEEFLEHVDGFSIGSNDLTQLTLGLDRDSDLIASLFDERDPSVKYLLNRAITACNAVNKYVGICGQGPSDHPDLAKWLMEAGIQSLSLNPDTVIKTWLMLTQQLKLIKKK